MVVLEDLSKIKSKDRGTRFNNRLSQVPFFEIRRILAYKAPPMGKRVETVDPRNTSRMDSRGLPDGVRRGCGYVGSDGTILDADHNAAINIAARWASCRQLPVSSVLPLRGRQTRWAGRVVNRPIVTPML